MYRRAITLVVRPVDEACNLACTYCNAAPYGLGAKRMGDDTLEVLIKQASQPRFHFTSFCWHGGEPTLAGIEFFRRVVALQYQYFGGLFMRSVCENIIQTNGLLLKGSLLDFFSKEGFVIGISLDGPDVSCNLYRFHELHAEKLLHKTISVCQEIKERDLELVIINVVHDQNFSRASDLYSFYRELKVDKLSFNPRFLSGQEHPQNIHPYDYRDFLIEIVALREEDHHRGNDVFSLGVVDHVLAIARGEKPSLCFLSDTCHRFINVNSQGDIFATCTDAIGVRLGDLHSPGLATVIENLTNSPLNEVRVALGGVPPSGPYPVGPGCPKYSHGKGDVYLQSLFQVASWYRQTYLHNPVPIGKENFGKISPTMRGYL